MKTNKEKAGFLGVWNVKIKEGSKLVREQEYYNLLPTVGRNAIVRQLFGTNTEELEIKHIAVGTGSTAVANADTAMEFEVARKVVGSGVASGISGNATAFFAVADIPAKTYTRFGAFGDGGDTASTATASTGILFSHVETLETVSATQTLTLTFSISALDSGS